MEKNKYPEVSVVRAYFQALWSVARGVPTIYKIRLNVKGSADIDNDHISIQGTNIHITDGNLTFQGVPASEFNDMRVKYNFIRKQE